MLILIQFVPSCADFRSFSFLFIFLFRQVLGDSPDEKDYEQEERERCGRDHLRLRLPRWGFSGIGSSGTLREHGGALQCSIRAPAGDGSIYRLWPDRREHVRSRSRFAE